MIRENTSIEYLEVLQHRQPIENCAFLDLVSSLQKNKRLKRAVVNGVVLVTNSLQFEETLLALNANDSEVTSLFLGYTLDLVPARALVAALESNTVLKTMSICSDDHGIIILTFMSGKNTSIECLEVIQHERLMQANTFRALVSAVKNITGLKRADLHGVMVAANSLQFAEMLLALYANDSEVRGLFIEHKLGLAQVRLLVAALEENAFVNKLNFYSDDHGVEILATLIGKNTPIEHLDLSRNRDLGDTDLAALALALKTNTRLKTLDLSFTRVSDEGIKHLSRALQTNTSLQHLFLCENQNALMRITDEGVKCLAAALVHRPSLYLNLRNHNGITIKGFKYLYVAQSAGLGRKITIDPPPAANLPNFAAFVTTFRKKTFGSVMLPMFKLLEEKKIQDRDLDAAGWDLGEPGVAREIFNSPLTRNLYAMLGGAQTQEAQEVLSQLKDLHAMRPELNTRHRPA